MELETPDLIIIGAMKCGTTSLHRYLDQHPDVGMSKVKELNFFFGDQPGEAGNWWRGVDWYRRQFPVTAAVRGEASPGYTSPDHPEVAARMAQLVPDARLIYLVRDPLDRAVSQYLHHRRDGDERRPLGEALLDPASQYIARSRYHERVTPFLAHYQPDQLMVVDQRDLLEHRRATLRRLFAFVGVDENSWSGDLDRNWNASSRAHPQVDPDLRRRFHAAIADDAERLRGLLPAPATGAGAAR